MGAFFCRNVCFALVMALLPCHAVSAAAALAGQGEADDDKAFPETELSRKLLATGLPLVQVRTNTGEDPTCTVIPSSEVPKGCIGIGVKDKVKLRAVAVHSEYKWDVDSCMISIRGNSSAAYPNGKKSYKLKFDRKKSLIDGVVSQKEWLLIKEESSAIYTEIGFKVNRLIHPTWTPTLSHVNLILNGDYKGLYVLENAMTDKIVPNGFIAEWDPYWWNEEEYITTPLHEEDMRAAYTFKEYSSEAPAILENFDNAIIAGQPVNYRSAAEWLLCHDILGTYDGHGSNIFLFYQPGQPLGFGCLWDFDTIFRTKKTWAREHGIVHFKHLMKNSDFVETYISLLDNIRVSEFVREVTDLQYLESLKESWKLDNSRWHVSRPSIDRQIEVAREWFETRFDDLDSLVGELREITRVETMRNEDDRPHSIYRINERIVVNNGTKELCPLK